MAESEPRTTMDTSEVDKWVGVPLGGGQFHDDIHVNDIRRWAQGMQNPNPLCFENDYAAESVFGTIVAPQSFTVNCTSGHGAVPAIQGYVEGTHMLFGGDEWWFFGPRMEPGDRYPEALRIAKARFVEELKALDLAGRAPCGDDWCGKRDQ